MCSNLTSQCYFLTKHFEFNLKLRYFVEINFGNYATKWLIPVAALSKAWVCGHSPAEILGSNSTGGMDVCLMLVLCVVRQKYLRRADHSSRGVLPSVLRRCVLSSNLANEETLAHWGLSRQNKQTNKRYKIQGPNFFKELIFSTRHDKFTAPAVTV